MSTIESSLMTEDLANTLGTLKVEMSDHPSLQWNDGTDQVGNIIRECFETARSNKYLVHVILARYSNDTTPIFQEFIFNGSFDPREKTVAHRFKPKSGRRTETISCEFTPAKRLDTPLSQIVWDAGDMEDDRPTWLCVVDEPGTKDAMYSDRLNPSLLSQYIITGVIGGTPPTSWTMDLAYGSNPLSRNHDIDVLKDNCEFVPFPSGNRMIKLSTAIDKVAAECDLIWDGVFPSGVGMRQAQYNALANIYVDEGELSPDNAIISWNDAFGKSWYSDGTTIFKSPVTFDDSLFCRDFLKGISAQLKSRMDIYDFDSTGKPIFRFLAFGQTTGTFPDLEEIEGSSSEDAMITDKDGVIVTRRGFDGSVTSPATATNPVQIEVPFAPYAIGYESSPPYDASRLTPNPALEFQDQWKCGFRGTLTSNAGAAVTDHNPLNPDGWVLGAHLFHRSNFVTQGGGYFPPSHDGNIISGGAPHDGGSLAQYIPTGWDGYFPIHAIYEKDRGELTDEEIKERQKNFLIGYALYFGRYIRGERGQLAIQFNGCVAPNWTDIANGQTYIFQPLTSDIEYISCKIERDILEDVITVHFEESAPDALSLSYKVQGKNGGNGSVDSQGSTGGAAGTDSGNLDGAVIIGPKAVHRNKILPTITGVIPLEITGFDTASNLLEINNSAGVLKVSIDGNGITTFANSIKLSGAATSIFLNGDEGTSGYVLTSQGMGVAPIWTSITDANDIVTNPSAAGQNLIIATNNAAEGLGIKGKIGSSADTFYLETSGAVKSFYLDSFGLLYVHNQLNFAGIGGVTQIGLDIGSSYDVGTAGFLMASGGAGYLHWVDPATIGVQFWTESRNVAAPNATVNVTAWTPNGGTTATQDAAIVPKGATGSLLAAIPDNTATGGNKRGNAAVDLQLSRNAATQVAGNNSATISGGENNTASGSTSTIGGGNTNLASGAYSTIPGGNSNTASATASTAMGQWANANLRGQLAFSSGKFGALGDAQASLITAIIQTTDAAANIELLIEQIAHILLLDNTVWTFSILVIGKQAASTNYASYWIQGSAVRGVGVGTVVVNGVVTATINDTIGCAAVATVLADVVNGGIKIVTTGKAATNINWGARLETMEITLA